MAVVQYCDNFGNFDESPIFVSKLSSRRLCIWVEECYTDYNVCIYIIVYSAMIRQIGGVIFYLAQVLPGLAKAHEGKSRELGHIKVSLFY